MRIHIIGFQSYRPLKELNGIPVAPFLGTNQSKVVQNDRILWIEWQGFVPFPLRRSGITQMPVNRSQVVANRICIRRRSQRDAVKLDVVPPVAVSRDDTK